MYQGCDQDLNAGFDEWQGGKAKEMRKRRKTELWEVEGWVYYIPGPTMDNSRIQVTA